MTEKPATSSETPPPQLPLIVCLGLVAALAPLSIDMYLPSFPTIREEFGTTAAQVQLTLSGYMLGFTLGQLGYGPLSDRFGRRPVLFSGIALFIVMTILCATASSIESLSVYRFLQAVGGAAGTVLSRAIIRDQFSGTYMARAMSVMLMFILLAPMISLDKVFQKSVLGPIRNRHIAPIGGLLAFLLPTLPLIAKSDSVLAQRPQPRLDAFWPSGKVDAGRGLGVRRRRRPAAGAPPSSSSAGA